MLKFLFVTVLMFVSFSTAMALAGKIKLSGSIKNELTSLLKATSDMHTAYVDQDEVKIVGKTKNVIKYIDRTNKKTSMTDAQQPHLARMLTSAKEYLVLTQMQNGEKRKESLKEAFKQLVQVAKTYKVARYKVFFCPKDKSVWLQKGWKAKNPIHPKVYTNCGRLVDQT